MYLSDIFDNTKAVRDFAKTAEAERLLYIPKGTEKQLYKIGERVDGNGHGFNEGIIIDVYENNGYFRYIVEYKLKPKARKKFTMTLRQCDIVVI